MALKWVVDTAEKSFYFFLITFLITRYNTQKEIDELHTYIELEREAGNNDNTCRNKYDI